jgi:hypothetical protein
MKRLKIRDAVDAENDGLAVDDEMLLPVLKSGFDNPWVAACPVIAIAADQSHAITVALNPQAVAVILDFVQPIRRVWNLRSPCRDAKIERLTHAL